MNRNEIQERGKSLSPPESVLTGLYLLRLGKLCCNLSVFCAAVGILALIAMLSSALWLVFSVLLILVTLGAILAIVPNYWDRFGKGSADAMNTIVPVASKIAMCAGIAACVLSVVAIIVLLTNRVERRPARVVLSFLALVASVILIAVSSVSGGAQ